MGKKIYITPECTQVCLNVEKFICLSIPIGAGAGPGGGGQAKQNPFMDEDANEDTDGISGMNPWED